MMCVVADEIVAVMVWIMCSVFAESAKDDEPEEDQ